MSLSHVIADLAKSNPTKLKALLERFKQIEAEYHPPKANPPDDTKGFCKKIEQTRGFVAPWTD